MRINAGPFVVTKWDQVVPEAREFASGVAQFRSVEYGDVRVQVVEYPSNFVNETWCEKGHVKYVVRGEISTELEDGRTFVLSAGDSWTVGDGQERHRSRSENGATVVIFD